MMRRLRPLLSALVAGSALLAPAARAEDARAAVGAQPAPSLAVTVDAVRREAMATEIAGTGLVEPWQEVAVGAETSGLVLSQVLVEEGDRVASGQVIARLDGAILEAQAAEQDALIAGAGATLEDALLARDRAVRLSRSGNVTEEALQTRQTTVKTAEASLAQARAVRRTLSVQIARTVVRAPFAGTVIAKPAVAGAVVQVGTEIARLSRDGVLEAAIAVPETRIASVAVNDVVRVSGPSGAVIEARVARIAEAVDKTTHLASVYARLPEASGLKAGMFVRGTIRAGRAERLTVAASALTWRNGRAAVFVAGADGAVSQREVTAGERMEGRVAVAGDLRPGEMVVTAGAGFLSDGNRVSVVSRNASTEGDGR